MKMIGLALAYLGILCVAPDKVLVAYITATAFSFYIVSCGLYGKHTNTMNSMVPAITQSTIAFYGVDILYIILFERSCAHFILHHLAAIYVCAEILRGNISFLAVTDYFFYIEASNLFINVYAYARKTKQYGLLKFVSLLLCCLTYVPCRTVMMAYHTYNMMIDNYHRKQNVLLNCIYVSLLTMSANYSWKLIRSFVRTCYSTLCRADTNFCKRVAMLVTCPNRNTWAIASFIPKIYISAYLLMSHIQSMPVIVFCLTDFLQIFVSFMYNVYIDRAFFDMLDFKMINAKIMISGICGMYSVMPAWNTLWLLNAISIVSFVMSLLIYQPSKKLKSMILMTTFLGSVLPASIYIADYSAFFVHLLGGIIWFTHFPEILFKETLFDSTGLMHIAVCAGDVLFINLITR